MTNLSQAKAKIQRILRDDLFKREILSTSWQLNFNRLASYKTSKKLFTKKTWEWDKKYNFHILLDMSSSMYGNRAINTIKVAINIAKLFKDLMPISFYTFNYLHKEVSSEEILSLNTPRKINDFISSHMDANVWFKKYWDEFHTVQADKIVWEIYWRDGEKYGWVLVSSPSYEPAKDSGIFFQAAGLGNREICNLLSVRKIARAEEWRSVMIIIQDWELAISSHYLRDNIFIAWESVGKLKSKDFVKQQIKRIEQDVELISFGVGTSTPSSYYSNFLYVSDPDEIYWNVVEIFERLI